RCAGLYHTLAYESSCRTGSHVIGRPYAVATQRRGGLGGALDVGVVKPGEGDAGYRDQARQVGLGGGELFRHGGAQVSLVRHGHATMLAYLPAPTRRVAMTGCSAAGAGVTIAGAAVAAAGGGFAGRAAGGRHPVPHPPRSGADPATHVDGAPGELADELEQRVLGAGEGLPVGLGCFFDILADRRVGVAVPARVVAGEDALVGAG